MAMKAHSQPDKAGTEGTLKNKVAMLFDGSNEGGRSLAVSLASYGADIAIVYREGFVKHARETKRLVEAAGRRCIIVPLPDGELLSKELIRQTANTLGRLDIFIDSSSPPVDASGFVDANGEVNNQQ
jgi:NAD(P)-dependent dehydrogenase (short-subunit alcohol dehydrogenase family)